MDNLWNLVYLSNKVWILYALISLLCFLIRHLLLLFYFFFMPSIYMSLQLPLIWKLSSTVRVTTFLHFCFHLFHLFFSSLLLLSFFSNALFVPFQQLINFRSFEFFYNGFLLLLYLRCFRCFHFNNWFGSSIRLRRLRLFYFLIIFLIIL